MGYDAMSTFEYTQTEPLSFVRGTLHPYILASILAHPSNDHQMAELRPRGLTSIDLVFINIPSVDFTSATTARQVLDQAAELQIGGPSLLRWTLKQWRTAAAVVDPVDYGPLIDDLSASGNMLTPDMRIHLLRRALAYLAEKDKQTYEMLHTLSPRV